MWSRRLETDYGIDLETYGWMLYHQAFRCRVCFDQLEADRETHVDHCHQTGKVRGILCEHCNKGIGHLRDDPTRLILAAKYLEDPEHYPVYAGPLARLWAEPSTVEKPTGIS